MLWTKWIQRGPYIYYNLAYGLNGSKQALRFTQRYLIMGQKEYVGKISFYLRPNETSNKYGAIRNQANHN